MINPNYFATFLFIKQRDKHNSQLDIYVLPNNFGIVYDLFKIINFWVHVKYFIQINKFLYIIYKFVEVVIGKTIYENTTN